MKTMDHKTTMEAVKLNNGIEMPLLGLSAMDMLDLERLSSADLDR